MRCVRRTVSRSFGLPLQTQSQASCTKRAEMVGTRDACGGTAVTQESLLGRSQAEAVTALSTRSGTRNTIECYGHPSYATNGHKNPSPRETAVDLHLGSACCGSEPHRAYSLQADRAPRRARGSSRPWLPHSQTYHGPSRSARSSPTHAAEPPLSAMLNHTCPSHRAQSASSRACEASGRNTVVRYPQAAHA